MTTPLEFPASLLFIVPRAIRKPARALWRFLTGVVVAGSLVSFPNRLVAQPTWRRPVSMELRHLYNISPLAVQYIRRLQLLWSMATSLFNASTRVIYLPRAALSMRPVHELPPPSCACRNIQPALNSASLRVQGLREVRDQVRGVFLCRSTAGSWNPETPLFRGWRRDAEGHVAGRLASDSVPPRLTAS